jgi:hypothetical protein
LSSVSAFAFSRAATAAGSSWTLHPVGRQAPVALGANQRRLRATVTAASVFMGHQLIQVGRPFVTPGANSLRFPGGFAMGGRTSMSHERDGDWPDSARRFQERRPRGQARGRLLADRVLPLSGLGFRRRGRRARRSS